LPTYMNPRKTARLPPLSTKTNVRPAAEFPAQCGFTHFSGSCSRRSANRNGNKSRCFARPNPRQRNAFAETVDSTQRVVEIGGGFHAAAANNENNIPAPETAFSTHPGGLKSRDHHPLGREAHHGRRNQRPS